MYEVKSLSAIMPIIEIENDSVLPFNIAIMKIVHGVIDNDI